MIQFFIIFFVVPCCNVFNLSNQWYNIVLLSFTKMKNDLRGRFRRNQILPPSVAQRRGQFTNFNLPSDTFQVDRFLNHKFLLSFLSKQIKIQLLFNKYANFIILIWNQQERGARSFSLSYTVQKIQQQQQQLLM